MQENSKFPYLENTGNQAKQYLGLYEAKCLDNDDPQNRDRILVHVYAREGELNYNKKTHQWVPVLNPFGGIPGMGSFMIPPIGAQGYVIFEGGDPRRPVWIGTSPYAPTPTIDKKASEAAGYGVIKEVPTIPAELTDPTRVVIKTQYPTLENPDPTSDSNPIENVVTMDEVAFQIIHPDQSSYKYSPGGISTATTGSFLSIEDQTIRLGVKDSKGKINQIIIDNTGISLQTDAGDSIVVKNGNIKVSGSKSSKVEIDSKNDGSVIIDGKNVIFDGQQIVVGPPGSLGGGGIVTSDCIDPFTGLPTHTGSSKSIAGG